MSADKKRETEKVRPPERPARAMEVVKRTRDGLIEVLTGIAASESPRKEVALSVGYLFQRFRAVGFVKAFCDEWDRLREKGQIKGDYVETEQSKACLSELLEFFDKDAPDERRFEAMKALYFAISTERLSDRSSPLPLQFMKICRRLDSTAVLVLLTAYKIFTTKKYRPADSSASYWLGLVANESRLKYGAAVEASEQLLIDSRFIGPRTLSDRSGITNPQAFRFTDFGLEFCKFIEHYETIKGEVAHGDRR